MPPPKKSQSGVDATQNCSGTRTYGCTRGAKRAKASCISNAACRQDWAAGLANRSRPVRPVAAAANGLACCLLIFGAHHRPHRIEIVMPTPAPATKPSLQFTPSDSRSGKFAHAGDDNASESIQTREQTEKAPAAKDHAARFALQCFNPGGETELDAIRARYASWSAPSNRFSDAQIGRALGELFNDAGITIADRGGRPVALGLSLKPEANL